MRLYNAIHKHLCIYDNSSTCVSMCVHVMLQGNGGLPGFAGPQGQEGAVVSAADNSCSSS